MPASFVESAYKQLISGVVTGSDPQTRFQYISDPDELRRIMSLGEQKIVGADRSTQNSLKPLALISSMGLTAVYAMLVSLHPLLSESVLTIFCLSLLFLFASAVIVAHPNSDPLDPLRLSALIFLAIYCVSPLFTQKFNWYFQHDKTALLEQSSAYVLFAFLLLCLGYALGPSIKRGRGDESNEARQVPLATLGLILFGVGFVAYSAAIISAGGTARLFGSGESRVHFFKGIGWLYWAAFFMIPGGALYFAASVAPRSRYPWLYSWPLISAFIALILIQGRFRALRSLVCLLILWHYQVRRFRAIELALFGSVGFMFFIFVGYARHPRIKPYLLSDPIGIIREVASNFLEYSQGILGDTISRIPQVMLGLDAFPDRIPHAWGGTFLLALNPVLRLVGLSEYQGDNLGTTFFQLAHPEFPTWLETGYHTSLAGEFLANFPWFVTPPAFILFGLLLRVLYVRLIRQGNTLISVCAYAIMLFPILSMLITGVSLVLFEIAVVVVPVLLVRPLWKSSRAPSRTFDEGAHFPERDGGGDSGWWT